MDTDVAQDSDFVRFWNDTLAPKFIRFKHILVDGLSRHSEDVFPQIEVNAGERILDAACGFGDTAALLADRTGPTGSVHGIDCVDAFLDHARDLNAGRDNVTFERADIEGHRFDGSYVLVFSRFGTMFFTNPVFGMRSMASALKPGGRLAIIVWRAREDNPGLIEAKNVLLRHLNDTPEDADTCGPGPFSQGNPDVLTGQLKAAGFEDIKLTRIDAPFNVGRDIDDAIAFQLAVGPAGEIYRVNGDDAIAKHDLLVKELTEMYRPFVTDDGVVMPSSSWLATAKKPA